MSSPVLCGAEATVVHVAMHRPIVGALICVALGVGGYSMTGTPDRFGGCGETGGELMRVVEIADAQNVCAVSEEAPMKYKID